MSSNIICPICDQPSCRPAWKYKEYTIYRCSQCQLEFVSPLRAAPIVYYQENYSTPVIQNLSQGEPHPGFQYTFQKLRQIREKYLRNFEVPRVLDVGCGAGIVLAELKKQGFVCQGIDFDPHMVTFAREHYGLDARVARVEDLNATQETYHLVMLSHVLEHVTEPLNLLKKLAALLEVNGILFIDVPNVNRFWVNRSLRKGQIPWYEYPPHHLTFWSMHSLSYALQKVGYQVLECHARPFSQENQMELFLANRLNLKNPGLNKFLGHTFSLIGRRLALQGETLFAVARRKED